MVVTILTFKLYIVGTVNMFVLYFVTFQSFFVCVCADVMGGMLRLVWFVLKCQTCGGMDSSFICELP